ncbi:hypothetical protein [Prolixibacter denitrificans]|uniref:Uncharacterized protein n=1 Tax=Prolixibacter denitrificans TaxID=1541063 RepID=A0A2P8C6L5_9BACT|nr:hypothetical protein [Prolixibacter denitrificans]PSK80606.1 hypothetical protein CLV93_11443 [Prolixibacter denitrificans]GET22099.1 hypothetical protein JCM18694_23450 [Prolixibacter denitrificans]
MKTTILKISLILALLTTIGTGCEKNTANLWEISPENSVAVIQQEVNGIVFKFCLLNENGAPATIFNEGENFSFFFSVTNNSHNDLYFDPDFAYYADNSFCKVYTSNDEDLGKPFKVLTVLTIGTAAYPFPTGESRVFQQSWVDDRDSVWSWEKATYESTHQPYLEKGNYYTAFKYRFRFEGKHSIQTDTLSFRINFRIQ